MMYSGIADTVMCVSESILNWKERKHIPVPSKVWSQIGIDLIGM